MKPNIEVRSITRIGSLLVETGAVTLGLAAAALFVRPNTWIWEITRGGNRIAWCIPFVVAAALWLAAKEPQRTIKRVSVAVHVTFVLLVLGALIVYWIAPFPD